MKKFAIIVFSFFAISTSSQAAVFDFVAEAAGNEGGATSLSFTGAGGHTLTATAYDWSTHATYAAATTAGTGVYNAYLDDLSGGKPGGLGVCKVLTSTDQCTPSSDDNVTVGEALRIVLSGGAQFLTQLTFRDANHNPVSATDGVFYRIDEATTGGTNGDGWIDTTFGSLSALVLTGMVIEFASDSNAEQFYLSSVSTVPVPAAVWLFGSALIGFISLSRRVKV